MRRRPASCNQCVPQGRGAISKEGGFRLSVTSSARATTSCGAPRQSTASLRPLEPLPKGNHISALVY